jgi:F420H(2)-dependent quinone reductase
MPLEGTFEPTPVEWVREQVDTVLATGTTASVDVQGLPVVVVTMRGVKTGKLRLVPLMRVEHAGCYAAVGSRGGAPTDPSWVANLRAHPEVEVQDGTVRGDYLSREVHGDERAQWWERAVAAYPDYAQYQAKTSRLIPVFVLEPSE